MRSPPRRRIIVSQSGPLFPVAPRADLLAGLSVTLFGGVVVIGAWTMDRLEQQGATIHTAPGLWPGVIGFLLVLLGGTLTWRSVTRARQSTWDAGEPHDSDLVPRSRFALAGALFFMYALGLVGHGVPFWLATVLFMSAYVFIFHEAVSRRAGGIARRMLVAGLTGGLTALVVTLVFEQVFYVRLP